MMQGDSRTSSFKRRKLGNQKYNHLHHRRHNPQNDRRSPHHNNRRRGDHNVVGGSSTGPTEETRNSTNCTYRNNPENIQTCSVCKTGAANYKCPKCRSIYCSIACCRKHKEELCLSKNNDQNDGDGKKVSSTAPDTKSLSPGDGAQSAKIVSKYVSNTASITSLADFDYANKESRNHDEYDGLEDGWIMTPEMMNMIGQSKWLRSELKDVGLQHLIAQISCASNCPLRPPANRRSTHNHNTHNNNLNNSTTTTEKEQLLADLKLKNPLFRQFLDKLMVVAGVLERHGDDATVPMEEWLARNETLHDNLTMKPLATRPSQHQNLQQRQQLSASASHGDCQYDHPTQSSPSSIESPSHDESSDEESASDGED